MILGENKVLETTGRIIADPQYVTIDSERLDEVAQRFAQEDLIIPSWDAPVFPEKSDEKTIDFFMLGNSINFAFTHFDTGEKYTTEFMGIPWKGAFGMWAALKKAVQDGVPLLDGEYLAQISEEDMGSVFGEIPMFDERVEIFREVGQVLTEKYSGHFHNLVAAANGRVFGGQGLVDRLTGEFPSFDDSVMFEGDVVRFDKRAQLAAGMIYGRFPGCFSDVDKLTVFADYGLPKVLRELGVLRYEDSLAAKVDGQKLIEAGSREELEIRASTIHAAKMLQDRINQSGVDSPVNALHIDYKLWESRTKEGHHHLTKTIAY